MLEVSVACINRLFNQLSNPFVLDCSSHVVRSCDFAEFCYYFPRTMLARRLLQGECEGVIP